MYLAQNYSELYLGGTNNKLHNGDFTYVPLIHEVRLCREVSRFGVNIYTLQGYWQTNVDALYVNGQQIASTTDSIIDSGTNMILGDSQTVRPCTTRSPVLFP